MPRLLVSSTRKSSGKTTLAVGLCAALTARGLQVQPFKKGPDYIDPMWLSRAAGRPCINLDFNTMSAGEIKRTYAEHTSADDFALIEGNKGLFDGLDVAGSDSNAALAKVLDAPVLLVLDVRGMTRGIAPLLLGYESFDADIKIARVILNHVGGARHESKLRAAIERYTDIKPIGAVAHNCDLTITERHLGLVTDSDAAADDIIGHIAASIAAQVDLYEVTAMASVPVRAPVKAPSFTPRPKSPPPKPDLKIGIARDSAFGFYYADDLLAFAKEGAALLPFDTLHDATLPEVDALFIGGGFPEVHAAALASNQTMRASIKSFVKGGGPVYAECGGLMYLGKALTWGAQTYEMVAAIPVSVEMTDKPVGRGYVVLQETGDGLWRAAHGHQATGDLPAHEFHYSKLTALPKDARFAYRVKRGYGINGEFDGLIYANVLATYAHLRNTEGNPWVARFVEFVRACKVGNPAQQCTRPSAVECASTR